MFTLALERFVDVLPEFKELAPLHWEELGVFKDVMPLDPAYEIYLARERIGELIFVGMRHEGKLVGYFMAFIAPALHYKSTLTATMDILYIKKEFRYRGHVIRMIDFGIVEFKRRGAKICYMGSKTLSRFHPGLDRIYRSKGFAPVDSYYGLKLGG